MKARMLPPKGLENKLLMNKREFQVYKTIIAMSHIRATTTKLMYVYIIYTMIRPNID